MVRETKIKSFLKGFGIGALICALTAACVLIIFMYFLR